VRELARKRQKLLDELIARTLIAMLGIVAQQRLLVDRA
jgi:hypothetical protein